MKLQRCVLSALIQCWCSLIWLNQCEISVDAWYMDVEVWCSVTLIPQVIIRTKWPKAFLTASEELVWIWIVFADDQPVKCDAARELIGVAGHWKEIKSSETHHHGLKRSRGTSMPSSCVDMPARCKQPGTPPAKWWWWRPRSPTPYFWLPSDLHSGIHNQNIAIEWEETLN